MVFSNLKRIKSSSKLRWKGLVHADLRNRYYREWISFLKNSESWSKQQIEEYQLDQLKQVVKNAYENTPGYRKLYGRFGVNPETIKDLGDFKKLPLVDKEMIRDNLEDFSLKVRGREYVATGGSTGMPFGFYRDKAAFGKELASKAYQYYRIGWKEDARQLVFRGIPIKRKNRMQFYPRFNEMRCSSYHLTPEQMELYRKRAFEYRPQFIKCYPSSGYIFAKWLKETGKSFPPTIKAILCASENLYDYQKELMKEVFNARVFSHYGHYELAVLAGFCKYEDTYHVLPQYGFAELLDKSGKPVHRPGQLGEIVGTSFINMATPFIRYRTNDLAVLKGWDCSSCGRPYQVWEKIEGRLQEFIVTGTGRYISMTSINMHDDIFDPIIQFQFYQEKRGWAKFRYISRDGFNKVKVREMKQRLMRKLGNDMELEMEEVKNIPPTKRGKHRFLIQNLPLSIGDI